MGVSIMYAAVVIGVVGILAGILLGVASEKFKVKTDEKEVLVREELPGNNCGACGYPGCDGLAAAIAKGDAPADACPVGGEPVAKKIATIVGGDVHTVRYVASVKCAGTCEKAKDAYQYTGPEDCRSAAAAPGGGPKACGFGCLGFGTCVRACPFDAITIEDGIAAVDKDKCRGCKQCVAACPRHIIEMVPEDAGAFVACSSKEFGKEIKAVCSVGCIGCGICAKTCPSGAITVTDHLAHVDADLCTGCGACKGKCPVKIIK